jgi:hypothetical protein
MQMQDLGFAFSGAYMVGRKSGTVVLALKLLPVTLLYQLLLLTLQTPARVFADFTIAMAPSLYLLSPCRLAFWYLALVYGGRGLGVVKWQ